MMSVAPSHSFVCVFFPPLLFFGAARGAAWNNARCATDSAEEGERQSTCRSRRAVDRSFLCDQRGVDRPPAARRHSSCGYTSPALNLSAPPLFQCGYMLAALNLTLPHHLCFHTFPLLPRSHTPPVLNYPFRTLQKDVSWLVYSPPTKVNRVRFQAPDFRHVGIVPDDAAGQQVFSVISRFLHPCIPALHPKSLTTISAYTLQKAKPKYSNRIRLERASRKQSSDTHKTPYDRLKRYRERFRERQRRRIHAKQTVVSPTQPHSIVFRLIALIAWLELILQERLFKTSPLARLVFPRINWGRGSTVVRLLTSHPGKPGSIPGGIAPGTSHAGITPDDATGRWVFSGISRFLPFLRSGAAPYSPRFSPSSALKTSMFRAAQISPHYSWDQLCLSLVVCFILLVEEQFIFLRSRTILSAGLACCEMNPRHFRPYSLWGSSGLVVRLLAPHLSEPGSIPGGVAPGFSHCPDDAAGRRFFFSGISRFPPAFHSGATPCSPRFTLIGSQDLAVESRPNLFTHSIH
ncbi:hypothetical protein PR048_032248 [Dryococelus australis]|uniref:Uncharacterized protein n=1 Tax=Dryococelus australis TaxID=614101 RepID=A0ABQ9G1Q6_9NEOP|nr:hypothetical protein PR048_032248 [Dryococelus australis]